MPFLETGLTIVVATREGTISPVAYLGVCVCVYVQYSTVQSSYSPSAAQRPCSRAEPYDALSWCLILLVCVNVSSFFVFLFDRVAAHYRPVEEVDDGVCVCVFMCVHRLVLYLCS